MANQIVINLFDRPNGLKMERTHVGWKGMEDVKRPNTNQRKSRKTMAEEKRIQAATDGEREEDS